MNKFTLLILILLCSCSKVENIREKSTNFCFPNVADSYIYPVVPGTNEWRNLSSTDEAYKVIQLPESVLKTISTKGLIDALLHAPLFTGFYLSSSSCPVDTWHGHYSRFNSAQELFSRKNSGDTLVDYYKEVNLDCIEKGEVYEDKERLFGLEFLFTKHEILEKINKQKKQELVVALLSRCKQNTENWREIVPMAWVMLNDNYEPMLKYFLENTKLYEESIQQGYVFSSDQSNRIISIAKNYIN